MRYPVQRPRVDALFVAVLILSCAAGPAHGDQPLRLPPGDASLFATVDLSRPDLVGVKQAVDPQDCATARAAWAAHLAARSSPQWLWSRHDRAAITDVFARHYGGLGKFVPGADAVLTAESFVTGRGAALSDVAGERGPRHPPPLRQAARPVLFETDLLLKLLGNECIPPQRVEPPSSARAVRTVARKSASTPRISDAFAVWSNRSRRMLSSVVGPATSPPCSAHWVSATKPTSCKLACVRKLIAIFTFSPRSPNVAVVAVALRSSNRLEVTVANLWVNRLIADAGPQRLARTTCNWLKATSTLQPSGLLGPVTLEADGDPQ